MKSDNILDWLDLKTSQTFISFYQSFYFITISWQNVSRNIFENRK